MKTIFIYDSCGVEPIKFFIVSGDYQHLDGVYINSTENELGQDELNKILDYNSDGIPSIKMSDFFPIDELLPERPNIAVIVVGFIP